MCKADPASDRKSEDGGAVRMLTKTHLKSKYYEQQAMGKRRKAFGVATSVI